MTPYETRTIDRLEKLWRAKAHKMPSDSPIRWTFCRTQEGDVLDEHSGRPIMVATCEIIETADPWSKIAADGVTVKPECWRHARMMARITALPLMVVVIAEGEARFLKVDDFGPEHVETLRLAAPAFRPLFRVDAQEKA